MPHSRSPTQTEKECLLLHLAFRLIHRELYSLKEHHEVWFLGQHFHIVNAAQNEGVNNADITIDDRGNRLIVIYSPTENLTDKAETTWSRYHTSSKSSRKHTTASSLLGSRNC